MAYYAPACTDLHVLVDRPDATVPMDVWWLVPQHVLVGVAEVLAVIELEEFFYDQLAGELHIVGLAVSQGNFVSSSHIPAKIKSKMEKMEKIAKWLWSHASYWHFNERRFQNGILAKPLFEHGKMSIFSG
uniref:Peptide transporter-like n=1 Tax=Oryza sativa subsp. japonica TaxID=39947 RepID=Q6EPL2_ORYSJ|nr:peptide transporter-like [Oryza sativa Japonica Group]